MGALARSRLITAAKPLGAPLKARSQYRIDDTYSRFWFRVLSSDGEQIEAG